MVTVAGKVVVVTGGARGLGAALVDEFLARGALKVHSTARSAHSDARAAVVTHVLDIRSQESVYAFAQAASDAEIVVNNAGIFVPEPLLTGDFGHALDQFDVNVFGTLRVSRAFAPVLRSHGGGAIVNVLSVMSWLAGGGAYGASKAGAWSMTNSLRVELEPQGTRVMGVHAGFIDTDMAAGITMNKLSPAVAARLIVDGLEADADEVLTDDATVQAKAALAGPPAGLTLTL